MIVDRFWKIFWILFCVTLMGGVTIAVSLFVMYTRPASLLAAVNASYDPNKDPFQNGTFANAAENFSLNNGYLYQDGLLPRFKSWSWSTAADWRSGDNPYAGSYSLKAVYAVPGGNVGMDGPTVDISGFSSISLEVYPDSSVGDLYIDLYGADGNSVGRQSLGWYASTTALIPNTWQKITIPLSNFTAGSQHPPKSFSGFSISSENAGTAYIDEVQLGHSASARPVWVAPPEIAEVPFNPFATSSPVDLPYTFSPAPDALAKWFTYFGTFAPGQGGQMQMGPSSATNTTGSMSVFRGGLLWTDYAAEANIDWGQVSDFAILVRFRDDGDFASCDFSHYGQTAQIYLVHNGTSEAISQTPGLPIKAYEPWKDVQIGAQAQGTKVSCLINGQAVLSADLPTLSAAGTAGFETWDPNSLAAPDTLNSFTVSSLSQE
jgi:hypothetical protein